MVNYSKITNFLSTMSEGNGPAMVGRHLFALGGFPNVLTRQQKYKDRNRNFLYSLRHLCESVSLPGVTIGTHARQNYGPDLHVPTSFSFHPLDITIICRDYMQEKEFFDDWVFSIKNANRGGTGPTFDNAYYNDITVDGIVATYSTEGNKDFSFEVSSEQKSIYSVYIREMYPIVVHPIASDWSSQDSMKLTVTFMYYIWEPAIGEATMAHRTLSESTAQAPRATLSNLSVASKAE